MTRKATTRSQSGVKRILDHAKEAHIIFAVIALLGGFLFLMFTPPLWGLDEPSHFARIYKISQGEIVPNVSGGAGGNQMPANFINLSNYRTHDILDVPKYNNVLNRADVTNNDMYNDLAGDRFTGESHYFPFIATYSPFAYFGSVIGAIISNVLDLSIGQTLFLTRLTGLLAYIGLASSAIYILRKSNIKWLFFVLALTPTAVFQAAVITADSMLIGVSLLFFALIFKALTAKKPMSLHAHILLAACALALPMMKINYLFVSMAVLLLPAASIGKKNRARLYKIGVLLASILPAIVWSGLTNVAETPELSQRPDQLPVSPSEQILHILQHPVGFIVVFIRSLVAYGDTYYQELFFTISGNSVRVPLVVTVVLLGLLLGIAISIKKELLAIRPKILLISIGASIAAATIFVALYAGFSPVGWHIIDGVQGRYFLPLVLPFILLAGAFSPINIKASDRVLALASVLVVGTGLMVSLSYVYLALY